MTRKQNRAILVATCLTILAAAVGLGAIGLRGAVTYFYGPTEALKKNIKPGQKFRLGGLVKKGSVKRGKGLNVEFAITDGDTVIRVNFNDQLPDLFKEGQGVVTEGSLQPDGSFRAVKVLAKHDEKYMPKNVADVLKKRGVWKGEEGKTGQ